LVFLSVANRIQDREHPVEKSPSEKYGIHLSWQVSQRFEASPGLALVDHLSSTPEILLQQHYPDGWLLLRRSLIQVLRSFTDFSIFSMHF
jgi:hypothetical protein